MALPSLTPSLTPLTPSTPSTLSMTPSLSYSNSSTSQMYKIKRIKEAIKENNIEELKSLAIRHGFINNKLRKQAWPMMLGVKLIKRKRTRSFPRKRLSINVSNHSLALKPTDSNTSTCSNKPNFDQIEKDISRSSLNFYLKKNQICEEEQLQSNDHDNLGRILHSLFDDAADMHYIQGFNDVVSVFYAVCGNQGLAEKLSKKVAKTFLKDYIMNKTDDLNFNSLKLIFKIIEKHDDELNVLFSSIENFLVLSFCVSWLITWFAHEIKDISVIARIYDYCLSSDHSISLYLSAALMIYCKQGLLQNVNDDVTLHVFFQQLEWDKLDFDKIIEISELLFSKYPPSMLCPVNNSLSSMSVSIGLSQLEEDIDAEIKEQDPHDSTSDDSTYEYNTDYYTPSVDPNEHLASFDIIDEFQLNKTVAVVSTAQEFIKQNNEKYKPKRASSKLNLASLGKKDFLDSLQVIPDALTNTIDDFVSLFGKAESKKNLFLKNQNSNKAQPAPSIST